MSSKRELRCSVCLSCCAAWMAPGGAGDIERCPAQFASAAYDEAALRRSEERDGPDGLGGRRFAGRPAVMR
jgi:hypothetical protein